jgi:hypothetical protein
MVFRMAYTFTNLLIAIVFGTKGRHPSIDEDLRANLHAYLGGIAKESRWPQFLTTNATCSNDLICRRSAALCSSGLATPGLTAPG